MKLILHCLMKSRTDSIRLRAADFCFTVINTFESQIQLILMLFSSATILGPSVGQVTQMFDFDLSTTGLLILLSYFPERPVDFLSALGLPGRIWFPVLSTVVWKYYCSQMLRTSPGESRIPYFLWFIRYQQLTMSGLLIRHHNNCLFRLLFLRVFRAWFFQADFLKSHLPAGFI